MEDLADLGQGVDDEGDLDGALAREMLVDRRSPNAEGGADPAHGDSLRPVGFEQVPSGGDDVGGPPGAVRGRRSGTRGDVDHAASRRNAGCLWATARISSSLESGPTPSKKTPTSAFHRRR